MQIGILGGSFDPVHHGHINLAVEMIEAHHLDEVWFCPSSINPNKKEGSSATPSQRLDILNLAIDGEPKFRILDSELTRQGTSFTIDTLQELLTSQAGKPHPNSFSLIIGEDAAKNFHNWRKPEEIIQLVPILVGRRSTSMKPDVLKGSPSIIAALEKGMTPTRRLDISSSEVRQRLAKRLYCGHLVHSKVLDYIYLHQLYYNALPIRK